MFMSIPATPASLEGRETSGGQLMGSSVVPSTTANASDPRLPLPGRPYPPRTLLSRLGHASKSNKNGGNVHRIRTITIIIIIIIIIITITINIIMNANCYK
ncbi:hypothetical protein E2C01_060572 [Portunus trituberculatus]|uniref:Uncharacterized protein n=1 Tax=Portunus trituberculatus TaxID=210409 RepID=A0A5B7H9U3_PORTR|nr:hypothetical protein [Portunus trituberculatus]